MHVQIEEIETGFVLTIYGRCGMLPEIKKHFEILPDIYKEIDRAFQEQHTSGYPKINQETPDNESN